MDYRIFHLTLILAVGLKMLHVNTPKDKTIDKTKLIVVLSFGYILYKSRENWLPFGTNPKMLILMEVSMSMFFYSCILTIFHYINGETTELGNFVTKKMEDTESKPRKLDTFAVVALVALGFISAHICSLLIRFFRCTVASWSCEMFKCHSKSWRNAGKLSDFSSEDESEYSSRVVTPKKPKTHTSACANSIGMVKPWIMVKGLEGLKFMVPDDGSLDHDGVYRRKSAKYSVEKERVWKNEKVLQMSWSATKE